MKSEYGIEYLIYGAHYDELDAPIPERFYFGRDILAPHDLDRYEQNIIPGIESEFYTYVAHPDLFIRSYPFLMTIVSPFPIASVKRRPATTPYWNIISPGFYLHRSINGWTASLTPISGASQRITV